MQFRGEFGLPGAIPAAFWSTFFNRHIWGGAALTWRAWRGREDAADFVSLWLKFKDVSSAQGKWFSIKNQQNSCGPWCFLCYCNKFRIFIELLLLARSLGGVGGLQLAGEALWVFAAWACAAWLVSGHLARTTSSITTPNRAGSVNGVVMGAIVILPALSPPFSERRWWWGVVRALFHAPQWDLERGTLRGSKLLSCRRVSWVCDHQEWWKIDTELWNSLLLGIVFLAKQPVTEKNPICLHPNNLSLGVNKMLSLVIYLRTW